MRGSIRARSTRACRARSWSPSASLPMTAQFMLADGRILDNDLGYMRMRVGDKSVITLVIFAEPESEPLLGAYALEGLALGRLAERTPGAEGLAPSLRVRPRHRSLTILCRHAPRRDATSGTPPAPAAARRRSGAARANDEPARGPLTVAHR